MQFKDMLNRTTYKRLNANKQTRLVRDLYYNDTVIEVEDASAFGLPNAAANRPGVIEIRGERIEYFAMNGNVLSQLRRSTLGTGMRKLYKAGVHVQDIGPSTTVPYTDTVTVQHIIADGVNDAHVLTSGAVLNNSFTNYSSLYEVFVGGTTDMVRLKKDNYVLYDPSRGPYSPSVPIADTDPVGTVKAGDKKFAKEFAISNVTATSAQLTLTKSVPQGTQITVVQVSGQAWDGNKNNPVNILYDTGSVANFLRAEPGVWYTGFRE
jgi:hypothetical protein